MIIELSKSSTQQQAEEALQSMAKKKNSKKLIKHFGKLKRGIDGLQFQKQARNEWD